MLDNGMIYNRVLCYSNHIHKTYKLGYDIIKQVFNYCLVHNELAAYLNVEIIDKKRFDIP